jgi:hypothetical protein
MYDSSLYPCAVHKKDIAQERDAGKRKAGLPWRGREDIGKPGSTKL